MSDISSIRAVCQFEVRILNPDGMPFDELESSCSGRLSDALGDLCIGAGNLCPDDGPEAYTVWAKTRHEFMFNSGVRSGVSERDRICAVCRLEVEEHLSGCPDLELGDFSLDCWEQCSDVSEFIDMPQPMSYWTKGRVIDQARLAGATDDGISKLSGMTWDAMKSAFLVPKAAGARAIPGRKTTRYGLDMEKILKVAGGPI